MGCRYTPPRKIPPGTFHPVIFPPGMFPPTLFRFVTRLARVWIGDSSRNRFVSTAYFALGGKLPGGGETGGEHRGGNFWGGKFRSPNHIQKLDFQKTFHVRFLVLAFFDEKHLIFFGILFRGF